MISRIVIFTELNPDMIAPSTTVKFFDEN